MPEWFMVLLQGLPFGPVREVQGFKLTASRWVQSKRLRKLMWAVGFLIWGMALMTRKAFVLLTQSDNSD